MLAKPKPSGDDSTPAADYEKPVVMETVTAPETTDEREAEMERRLAMLGIPEPVVEPLVEPVVEVEVAVEEAVVPIVEEIAPIVEPVVVLDDVVVEEDLLAMTAPEEPNIEMPPPAPLIEVPVAVTLPEPVAVVQAPVSAAKPNNKSALLVSTYARVILCYVLICYVLICYVIIIYSKESVCLIIIHHHHHFTFLPSFLLLKLFIIQARIMAAQERAKQAQLKQASQQTFTPEPIPFSMETEKDKMMRALTGTGTGTGITDEQIKPPPPSFDVFEKQMQQMQNPAPVITAMAPPAFDDIAMDVFAQNAPSAPPAEHHAPPPMPMTMPMTMVPPPTLSSDADLLGGDFYGVMPMAPPMQYNTTTTAQSDVPSFDQVMQHQMNAPMMDTGTTDTDTDTTYDFALDEYGNKLSPEEQRRMVEEQRAIMEHIERETRNNKASEAAIKADAFASRMSAGNSNAHAHANATTTAAADTTVQVTGFSASDIEEQRNIMAQIEKETKGMMQEQSGSASASAAGRKIQIGGGQQVSLHGQEKTQEAIRKGTAQLVLCLNCNNWMQVAETATLMFCPMCSVVSPVVKQDQIMTKEEILQMEEDRKLAEMLQAEENAAAGDDDGTTSDYPGNRRATTARGAAAVPSSDKSWWDTISDALVGVGVSAEPQEDGKRSAEINVSRPPGGMSPSQRVLHSAVTGEEGGQEHLGLLGASSDDDYGNSGHGLPAARVAQSKPLFSCVVDSISNTATAASTYMMGEEEEVHGVDTTSFLTVPNVGRDKNEGGGNYFALPPNE